MINICIPGHPRALKRHRTTRTGHIYDPSYKDKKIINILISTKKPMRPIKGDVGIDYIFTFKRPKTHYRTGKYKDQLKDRAPYFHISVPDIDNLIKLYNDVLQDGFIKNDSQICKIKAKKVYGKIPSVEINIRGAINERNNRIS